MIVLAGDIGGTHARLTRFQVQDGRPREPLDSWTTPSRDYSGPAPIVRQYLEARAVAPEALDGIAIAIAGPFRDGVVRVPNLGWTVDTGTFPEAVGFPGAVLLNDFVAVAHGVPLLSDTDLAAIQEGTAEDGAPIAVLGPGTGLGHAYLVWDGRTYRVEPSEGGHADFAPRTAIEWALAEHLRQRYGHASWERVISGPGLVNVYEFLAATHPSDESAAVRTELESSDPAAVIARLGAGRTDTLCARALAIFIGALGAQAGNLALTLEAYGGVYIAGGIAPQMVDALRAGPFLEAFRSKGRLSDLLDGIPVHVVVNDRVGLLGAARVACIESAGSAG